VRRALEERGYETRTIANPLVRPARFSWQLDTERSVGSLAFEDGRTVANDEFDGVLVRTAAWIDPAGWRPADLAYVQAETQAALLAWLWSLACPVVNRYRPAIWYRPRAPLLFWRGLLVLSGLSTPETLVTNVGHEAREFARRGGLGGVVCGALTGEARFLVATDGDWNGVAKLQEVAPVCFSVPHGEAQHVCVAGNRVVWDREPTPEDRRLEPRMRGFAAEAGLSFVALTLAPTPHGVCVVAVEPQPCVEAFGDSAREEIVEGIVELLTKHPIEDRRARSGA
jgi:hypothetical protein